MSATLPTSPRRTTTLAFEEVAVGDALPALEIPLTRTLIVSTAIASRDYQDVHHDPSLAVERGSQDIFMNILSTNGLVGRYVTDWSGPGGVLTDVDGLGGESWSARSHCGFLFSMRTSVSEPDAQARNF